MTGAPSRPALTGGGINLFRLEMSQLVGQPIRLFTRQFPGKLVEAKVISATENEVLISGIGERDLLSNMVNYQNIIVQFPYRAGHLDKCETQKDRGRQDQPPFR